jgi:hypothetical protein
MIGKKDKIKISLYVYLKTFFPKKKLEKNEPSIL